MASQLENLEALLSLLWESLGTADADKRASLAREYRATLDKVESLKAANKVGDPVDEVANRRAARRSGPAKGAARAKSGSV
jgi:hypothetical protein